MERIDKLRSELSAEASRIEEDVLHSAKGHFCAGARWGNVHLWLGIPASVLAGLSGVSALSSFDNHTIIAGVLALFVGAITAIITFLNPQERAKVHHHAGTEFNSLRNQARIFRQIVMNGQDDDPTLTTKLVALDTRRNQLNENSPQIPGWAYHKAKKSIDRGEAQYQTDSEN